MTAGRSVITQSQSWNTPPDIVEIVKSALGGVIELDPCSNEFSVVGAVRAMTETDDGLTADWRDAKTVFVNPPYGRGISDWLEKCAKCSDEQSVIALVPVAVNTGHWKKWIFPFANCVAFLNDTRPKFWHEGKALNKGAPMACCLVHWGKNAEIFIDAVKGRCNVMFPSLKAA